MQEIDAFLARPSSHWSRSEREAGWVTLVKLVDALSDDASVLAEIGARLTEAYAKSGVDGVCFEDDERIAPAHWYEPGPSPKLLLAREVSLDLSKARDVDLGSLATSPWTRSITRVVLHGGRLDDLLPTLVSSPLFVGAEVLDLRASRIGGDEGAATIACSPAAEGIAVIDLAFCGVTEAGVEALLASPRMSALERIIVDANCIDPYGDEGEAYQQDLWARLEARRIELNCV